MSFSTRLRERRIFLGLSRAELAKKLGVTIAAVSNYENGISVPREKILFLLFRVLEVEPNYLWQDELDFSDTAFVVSCPEYRMIEAFRRLDARGQQTVLAALEAQTKLTAETLPPLGAEPLEPPAK